MRASVRERVSGVCLGGWVAVSMFLQVYESVHVRASVCVCVCASVCVCVCFQV